MVGQISLGEIDISNFILYLNENKKISMEITKPDLIRNLIVAKCLCMIINCDILVIFVNFSIKQNFIFSHHYKVYILNSLLDTLGHWHFYF